MRACPPGSTVPCRGIMKALRRLRGGRTMSIAQSWLMGCGLPALVLSIASGPSMAESRGYAISFFHMATYAEQGDCPNGGNGATTEIHLKILMDQGYTR